ncbi:MAG: dynamin family protein [Porphyromonas sp.]|uniref:dynamin family protein n=1 Tax=Porphyromonas sp. TaxID=1924944 RepID=UPI001CB19A4A|nr:dynamin family protein [Porphyromonas sp.]MBF1405799.1 dynamin family protein [Porphyromonas sp.]
MFDFILRWFGKGKPQEDTSSQGEDTSFFGSNSLFAKEGGDEATSTSIEEAERANAAELCGQADDTLRKQIAELTARLAKAQKALKNAEEENEELEEECEQTLKRERAKTQEVKEQVSAMEKQLSSLQETLDERNEEKEKLNNELTATKDRVNCRGEALSFVREVLTAQVNSERSELEQKVEEMVALIHSDECRAYITLTDEEERDLSMWQSECAKSWIQGKVKVAFIGEFSAGKTSIVNRLLQDGDPHAIQLPVSSKATTAIPTYISGRKGGGKATYRFYTPDSILKEISEDTFRRVSKEVLEEVGGISSMIKYFVMAYANKGLERLSILDTPGFSSQDKEDEQRTMEVINECDALFWVVDVNNGQLNSRSIRVIRQYLHKPLYIIINKVDTKSQSEVKQAEQAIRATCSKEKLSVKGFIHMGKSTPLSELHQVFSALGSSSSLDLLDTISELIQEGLDEQMNIKKECDAKRKQYDQELSELETTFSDNLDTVAELAEDAVRIPHFKDPFWGSKRYEMDASEYKELEEKLTVLSEAAPGILKGNLDAIEQAVSKIQSAEEEAEKCRSKLADLEGLKKRFDQLHKQIDQLSQLHR